MPKNKDEMIDIKEIALRYLKEWKWFILSIVCCVGFALVYLKTTEPIYQINANVLIKDDDAKSNKGISALKNFSFGMGGALDVQDELHVISSYTIMRQAVKDLKLYTDYTEVKYLVKRTDKYEDKAFLLDFASQIADTLQTELSFKLDKNSDETFDVKIEDSDGETLGKYRKVQLPLEMDTDYGHFKLSTTDHFKKVVSSYEIIVSPIDVATENYLRKVNFGLASKKANVISLSVGEGNFEKGRAILDRIIQLYNEDALIEKNLVSQNTAVFIKNRLDLMGAELAAAENEIEKYKKNNNIFNLEIESKALLEQNKEIQTKLVEISAQIAILSDIESYLFDNKNKYQLLPISLGVSDESSLVLIQEYNKAILERIKLLRTTSEHNPSVLMLNDQLNALRSNVVLSLGNVKNALQIQQKELNHENEKFLSRFNDAPTIEKEFLDIKRNQAIKEQLVIFLMEKREENSLTLAVTAPKAKIIDAAYRNNKPISPNKKMIIGLALLLGVFLPVCVIYILDSVNVELQSKQDLERLTNLPVLGEICQNKSKEHIVVKEGDTSSIVELFKLIRTNIHFILNKKEEKVILITSTVSGEGKSFFSINFALSLSLLKKKVVLVGLDIRNPKLVDYLDMEDSQKGITNYLASTDLSPDQITIHSSLCGKLDIITAGPIPPNPSELLLSERLDDMFNYLRTKYDYIIVDTAPVGIIADTFALNRISDATLYVCRAKYSKKDNIAFAHKIAEEGKLKKVSFVINGTDGKQGYGYGYGKN
ncbi:MAG: polysaccharide biosynthesis tyrosine autokinase [Bacteroidales bacterium]